MSAACMHTLRRSATVRRRPSRRVHRVGVPGARGARGSLGHVRFVVVRSARLGRSRRARRGADGDGSGGVGRERPAPSARGFGLVGNDGQRSGGQGPARVERVHARRRRGGERQGDGAREAGRGGAQAAGQARGDGFRARGAHATVQIEGARASTAERGVRGKGDGGRGDRHACMLHATRDVAFSRCLKFD